MLEKPVRERTVCPVKRTLAAVAAMTTLMTLAACGGGGQTEFDVTATADSDGGLPSITVTVSCDDSGTVVVDGQLAGDDIRDVRGTPEKIEWASDKVKQRITPAVDGSITVTPDSGDCTTKIMDSGVNETLENITSGEEITAQLHVPESESGW